MIRDRVLLGVLRSCAAISAGVLLLIVVFTMREAAPAMASVRPTQWLTDPAWHPTAGQFNLTPLLTATLAAALGSVVIAAPLGVGVATFLNFYAPRWLAALLRQALSLLAGVPSVVYGLWGMAVLAPILANLSPLGQGQSLAAGSIILALMTLPTIAIAADNAVASVADEHLLAAAALGLGRRATIWQVVVPTARTGIVTGVILQTGRALGETMAVLMVCGNIVQHPSSLFAPVRTLTANIALEMGYATEGHRAALFFTAVVLLFLIILIMLAAQWNSERRRAT